MNFEFSYSDITKQCNTMAYLNVISFCLLSGCGSIEMPHEQELTHIYSLFEGTNNKKMPKNITFMSSLYKRCIATYAAMPETPYDFKSFRWIAKKTKQVIEPNVLAHSICSMTALMPLVENNAIQLEQKKFIYYCLGVNSLKQAHFLVDFLKVGDFYYSGIDTGDNSYGEYSISINNENPDIRTQFYVIEALASILKMFDQSELYPNEAASKFEKALNVLPVVCENIIENINNMSSRDLSVICLSLQNTYNITKLNKEIAYNTVNAIGFELCERLARTGDIFRNMYDDSNSSFVTLCNCMHCLIKLNEVNPIRMFETAYLKLYDRIDSYWSNESGLFLTSGKSKQRHSFKNISAILAALRALRASLTDPDLYMHVNRQLSSFYSSSIVSSKLFNNQFYPILQENKLELHTLGSSVKDTAPVFSDYFDVKVNKKKYYCEPDVFEAEDILLGCKYLLL